MNNDILPPQRPSKRPLNPPPPVAKIQTSQIASSPAATPTPQEIPPVRRSRKRLLVWVVLIIVGAALIAAGIAVVWYQNALRPVAPQSTTRTRIQVDSGSSPAEIAKLLKQDKLIKSQIAFEVYTRLSGTRSKLQAGTYSISPSESTQDVVNHMVAGRVDKFDITFFPGATLTDHSNTPESKKTDVETVLLHAGYSQREVTDALSATYESPLFATKPASADLEGYIYGETYSFGSSATAKDVLERTFAEYDAKITENNLVDRLGKQGLTLYQGITLASIIQREVAHPSDQKQVAQIFLLRPKRNMPLGSDVTYHYAAQKLGVTPSPDLDSPYNTRKVTGLPPGPISSPGLSALEAVASPAEGDYLFFLSGDDGITYYARTDEEHKANIQNHCQIKCANN